MHDVLTVIASLCHLIRPPFLPLLSFSSLLCLHRNLLQFAQLAELFAVKETTIVIETTLTSCGNFLLNVTLQKCREARYCMDHFPHCVCRPNRKDFRGQICPFPLPVTSLLSSFLLSRPCLVSYVSAVNKPDHYLFILCGLVCKKKKKRKVKITVSCVFLFFFVFVCAWGVKMGSPFMVLQMFTCIFQHSLS